MSDLRFLARRKALTAIAVVTMGLAIGATAASLSVLEAFLLSSLAVPDADRLVVVQPERDLPGRGAVKFNDAYPNYLLLRDAQHSFADVAATVQSSVSLDEGGDARHLAATRATASFAPTFRVQPFLGRWIAQSEEGPSPAAVIVISHRLWQTALGGNRGAIGQSLLVNGEPHTVIGVMPSGFDQPFSSDAWLPFDIPASQRTAVNGGRQLILFARLADGTPFEAAERAMAAFTTRAIEMSADNKEFRYTITTLRETLLQGADESALFVLAGAAGLMLLAVLNLSSLLIAWGFERQREFAVRIALGAGGGQVIRLVLRQSLVVVALAGVTGVGLSAIGLRVLASFDLGPTVMPFVQSARLDAAVLLLTVLVTLLAGVAAGILPIVFSNPAQLGDSLRSMSRSATLSRGAMTWQRLTVLGQTALSMLILAAAGLIALSFWRLAEIPNGFTAADKLVARVVFPETKYPTHADRAAFGRALGEHLAAEPSLASSGFTTTLPVSDVRWGSRFFVELPDGSISTEPMLLHFRRISPTYFEAMGIPVLRGRAFTARDDTSGVPIAIVSRALADRLWPETSAVGQRIVRAAPAGGKPQTLQIVGVVGNAMDGGYEASPGEAVYLPFAQVSFNRLSIVGESRAGTAEALAAIKRALRKTDPTVAAGNVSTLDGLVLQANALPRLRTVILLVFAIVALGVVSLGTYGVMSQLVSTRQREFALRLVFGARPAQLGRIVVVQVARIALPGIAIGLGAAWLAGGALRTFLFGIEPTSAPVFTAAGALLSALTVLATIPCVVRAMRVDARSGTE